MADQGPKGLQRIIKATVYSYRGFIAAYQHEEAFRQETWLDIVLIPLGVYLGDTPVEQVLLVAVVLVVLLTELLNSAIEAAIDRISEEHHELSARAKDIGSSAVFTSLTLVVVVWAGILVPRYWL